MEQEIGIFEAKNKLSELADTVARSGIPITITRRGKPLVRMTPAEPSHSVEEVSAALARLEAWGKSHKLVLHEGETLKDIIAEGRR